MDDQTGFAEPTAGEIMDEIERLSSRIERLVMGAESGEDWAHICLLEAQLVSLTVDHAKTLENYPQE